LIFHSARWRPPLAGLSIGERQTEGRTMTGRVLTNTEQQLYNYCMNERQAIEFAKYLTLPDHASFDLIENAVAFALVRAKEAVSGRTEIEYIGGQRRDHLRRNQ
jgi:hypothetical protein